jgi:signal transduction histidine kinase
MVYLEANAVRIAFRALSNETSMAGLLEVLIRNSLERVGAERCAVALLRDGEFWIEAEARATVDGVEYVMESRQLQECDLRRGVFMAVARTHRRALLDDAPWLAEFERDVDATQRTQRSVLCVPLLGQSGLLGILYAEKDSGPGVFTEEKVALLEVSALQAAISIENARLCAEIMRSNSMREAAKQELRELRDGLGWGSSHNTMRQLAASIIHEVSQPLVSIASSAGAALRFMRHDEPNFVEVEDALKRIELDSTRAHNVVRSLRALAKLSAPSFSMFDLHDIVQEVLLVTRSQLEEHTIQFDTNAVCGTSMVWGDKIQIQQVVLNLVINAIEAMYEITDRERRLFIRVSTSGGHVRLAIEDTGVGVEKDAANYIFAPFFTTKSHGMGMGLPICRSIVQAHAGQLTMEPLSPYGTCFEVWLPEARQRISTYPEPGI